MPAILDQGRGNVAQFGRVRVFSVEEVNGLLRGRQKHIFQSMSHNSGIRNVKIIMVPDLRRPVSGHLRQLRLRL